MSTCGESQGSAGDDAVLYLAIGRDAEGRTFGPAEAVRLLSAASAAPVYGPLETYIGRGAVAGMVYSFEDRGRRMGELVHEVLSSRPAPVPPPVATEPPTCMADARQLERFGLDASLLPPGCDIRFVPPSLWREYRWYVLAALVVILAQAALIVGLVCNAAAASRRRARCDTSAPSSRRLPAWRWRAS